MPPPNANADLHAGAALFTAIQDTVIRYQRMQGKAALWVPGADHAGFETWVVYEKHLNKQGKTRFDYSREELYKQVWDFVQQNKTNFESQFRALGASADWSRFTFTLDEKVVRTAYSTFKRMWDDKLIYRGERLVNFCTYHGTSFADIEVEYKDQTTPLYYMKYGPFTLATTRPETKFGDTAVAVNPDDKRYKEWIDKVITVDGVNEPFEVRVVADKMVDPKFGTGVVKITPAHDFNDWEVSQRHNLPAVRVINHDGTMNHIAGRFEGLTVTEARKAVVEALKEKGLLVKVDEHYKNRVGVCYKCGTVIEPMLLEQWFIDMKPLAEKAITVLEDKQITFHPASKRTAVIDYLKNIKDWNISRQIAWGIPIPAFRNIDDSDDWIFDERVDQETIEVDGRSYRRDPDVFDTWFSSGQWPFITLNYPDGDDFNRFFPTSLMETGGEILFAWVARMIMFSLYVTGEIPFKEVYIHGNVKAEDGTKMSKSKGNAISAMEGVKTYGADALRLGLMSGRTAGAHQAYTPAKMVGGRNFANKLWNIARFVEGLLGDEFTYTGKPMPETIADHWILSRINAVSTSVAKDLEGYNFSVALERTHQVVWDEFADWYIEASKAEPNESVLAYALEAILKIVHPFAPFVTETIWQTLAWEKDNLLMTRAWPEKTVVSASKASQFESLRALVNDIRQASSSLQLAKPVLAYSAHPLLEENRALIVRLANLDSAHVTAAGKGLPLSQSQFGSWLEVTTEQVAAQHDRLVAEQGRAREQVGRLKGRLANKNYTDNAPAKVVAETRQQLSNAEILLDKLTDDLKRLADL